MKLNLIWFFVSFSLPLYSTQIVDITKSKKYSVYFYGTGET